MANYHYSVGIIRRSIGRSVTAAAAYRAAEDIRDSRTGEHHKYGRRTGVIESEILAPDHAPEWVQDRSVLWNAIEHREDQSTRRDTARLAREVELSLPHELTHEERRDLLRGFAQDRYIAKGMIADISFHKPGKGGDFRNFHAHILLTLRPLTKDEEFANTERTWNSKQTLLQDREEWANYMNRALEKAGSDERVDHRSFIDRDIHRLPTRHLGPAASEMERRGEATQIGNDNREITEWNREQEQMEQDLRVIDLAIEREKRKIAKEKLTREEMKSTLLLDQKNAVYLSQLDDRRALEARIDRQRMELEATNNAFYNKAQTQEALTIAQNDLRNAQTLIGRLSGREQEAKGRVEALRLNLEDIERREAERHGFLNRQAAEELQALHERQQNDTEKIPEPPTPDPDSDTEDFREYTPDYVNPPTLSSVQITTDSEETQDFLPDYEDLSKPPPANQNDPPPKREPDPGPELER